MALSRRARYYPGMPLASISLNAHDVLVVVALGLAVTSIFKPSWPLLSVAVILLCAALLAR